MLSKYAPQSQSKLLGHACMVPQATSLVLIMQTHNGIIIHPAIFGHELMISVDPDSSQSLVVGPSILKLFVANILW
jgi:hypothetical protein